MSKLWKFKYSLTIAEAAELLTRLIDEDVSEADIESLLLSHWINGHYSCHCAIVKTKFFLGAEEQEKQLKLENYMVEIDQVEGICFGLPYPCGEVLIDGAVNAFALADKNGGLYVLRDIDTDHYLGPASDQVFFHTLNIEADSIYKLAEIANINEPAPESDIDPAENKYCDHNQKLYALHPKGSQSRPAQQMMTTQANLDTPTPLRSSRTLLTLIAALCKGADIDITERGASQRLMELTEQVGAPVNDETIRKVFTGIPDALERRSK
ncbi:MULTISPECIES: hypothetical protein [unclassified Pseudomonas]|uniref:hypothetical protein n=1 Tax=unclassified Pseudomonas TaxID=196821 RepID=UPI002B22C2E2|nr:MULTISPECIES: hypothetical protein [unclassified Pseudomonas]MEA9979737.1 hypothetical protein [Pseudomonas sp. RTS4]MEB0198999.1 hypothetical protein [Pseudomonas sp. 5S4]MEB0247653.1 hypothetical protein [Pseudomonas sp. 10S5]